jgi:hypothetical protein
MSANPKLGKKDLPTSHDVRVFLQNAFVPHLNELKEEIKVSSYKNRHMMMLIILGSAWKGFDDSRLLDC